MTEWSKAHACLRTARLVGVRGQTPLQLELCAYIFLCFQVPVITLGKPNSKVQEPVGLEMLHDLPIYIHIIPLLLP